MAILLKHADLAALDRTLKSAFLGAYEGKGYTPRWPLLASRQSSTSRRNTYPSIIDAASIREWAEGERVVNGLVIEGASVTNQKWELTYGVRRDDLDDDLTGTVAQAVSRVRSGAGKYLRHPDKLIFNIIKSNGTALDGVALFATTHPVNPKDSTPGNFSNTTTGALTATNVAAARATMMELVGPDGDPLNENPNVILVPPALETTARKIAQADEVIYSATATDTREMNVYKGNYTVVVAPHLAASFTSGSDSYWYLLDTNDPEDRGLIFQEREPVELVTLFDLADANVFQRDEYVWGTRARYTAAAGNPKKICRRTG
jgi:phage major head subunit gpT-like protein